jgi:2-keto-4-pentenoate hydratase/2-oxohepta-3-ene-1,7-dioic acid hydratase in catechol pathway
MKIARLTDGGPAFWALVDTQARTARRIAGAFADWAPAVTASGGAAAPPLEGGPMPLDGLTFLPPIEKTNKVVIAGANYSKHLQQDFKLALPTSPAAFLKSYGALIGANDPIRYPPMTAELDHEVELVVVVGAERLDHDDPLSCVLGYTVGNDVSARDVQRSGPPGIGMDLFGAKSQDKTTGLGPWIVTRDEFPNGVQNLRLTLSVNGEMRQDGTTADMTWPVDHILRFTDSRSSFESGDVLFTGTPDGVGQGSGRFLNPGDVVEATVEGIGSLRNVVGERPAA